MKIRFHTACSVLALALSFTAMVISYNHNSSLRSEAKELDQRLAKELDKQLGKNKGPSYVVLTDDPPTEYPLKMSCYYPEHASLVLETDNTESIISYSTKVYKERSGYTFRMGQDSLTVIKNSTKEIMEEFTECTKF